MARIVDTFKNFFSPLSGAQRALFGLLSVGIIVLMGMLFYWALQPNYAVLFGSLSPDSAQSIVEELESTGVPYELKDNGEAVMVPRDRVYNLRLKFASEGASGSDYRGYELFDQNTLGMTDFMQRINKKRALEGELARTINNLRQVESSRIHIVMPERSPFQQEVVEPSASVILNLNGGAGLGKEQIQGIGALISGSVEGLRAENVVILDQDGNRISENVLVSKEAITGSAHMRVRQETETYLTSKGQTMLDRVLGPGNSILRVSTEHNFDKVIQESEKIDPDSRIVISEEKQESVNSNQTNEPNYQGYYGGQDEAVTTNERQDESTVQIRNYEVSNIREKLEKTVGEITHISASILLNHKASVTTNEEGEEVTTTQPYTEEEIEEIRTVMAAALGIQNGRGDVLTVQQIKFKDNYVTGDDGQLFNDPFSTFELIRWIIIAIVVIAVSVMVYRMSKNFNMQADPLLANNKKKAPELADHERDLYIEGEQQQSADDLYTKKLTDEAKELTDASAAADDIRKYVENNTAEAASYIRSMMSGVLETD